MQIKSQHKKDICKIKYRYNEYGSPKQGCSDAGGEALCAGKDGVQLKYA